MNRSNNLENSFLKEMRENRKQEIEELAIYDLKILIVIFSLKYLSLIPLSDIVISL